MNKLKKKGKQGLTAIAFHGKTEDGSIVGMLNLRVVVIPDGQMWFARGLEIDYAASGTSIEDVKKGFQEGLYATVDEHLKVYGDIEKLLKPAPLEVWKELYHSRSEGIRFRFSQVAFHERFQAVLPFGGIEYLQSERVAA